MATSYSYDAYETTIARTDLNSDGTAKFWNGFSDGPGRTSYRNFRWTAAGNGWDANQFTVTESGTNTQTLSDVDDGGACIFLQDGTDNSYTTVRQGKGTDGSGGLWITHKSGKYIFIEGVFKISDATQSDMFFGVFNKTTDPEGTIPTSGFFFRKDDGDTQLDCVCVATGTSDTTSSLNVKTMDTAYHKYGIKVYGGSKVEFYVDDLLVNTMSTTTSLPASTVFMSPTLQIKNGEAVAKSLTLKDWAVSAQI